MRRPKLTIGRLMALVALAATTLGLWSWMARRAVAFHAGAVVHRERAYHVSLACRIDNVLLEHHEGLARKYEMAARRPWLSVEPDPPEPE